MSGTIVRKEQMDAFGELMRKGFEDRMVVHLNEVLPSRSAELGEEKLREEIRFGMESAASYEIVTERDVARYIDLMFLLGRDFDASPATPWARPILTDKSSSAENRVRRLQLTARKVQAQKGSR
jgi:hypothetical protein